MYDIFKFIYNIISVYNFVLLLLLLLKTFILIEKWRLKAIKPLLYVYI